MDPIDEVVDGTESLEGDVLAVDAVDAVSYSKMVQIISSL
jgi:hypothetical protein